MKINNIGTKSKQFNKTEQYKDINSDKEKLRFFGHNHSSDILVAQKEARKV